MVLAAIFRAGEGLLRQRLSGPYLRDFVVDLLDPAGEFTGVAHAAECA